MAATPRSDRRRTTALALIGRPRNPYPHALCFGVGLGQEVTVMVEGSSAAASPWLLTQRQSRCRGSLQLHGGIAHGVGALFLFEDAFGSFQFLHDILDLVVRQQVA